MTDHAKTKLKQDQAYEHDALAPLGLARLLSRERVRFIIDADHFFDVECKSGVLQVVLVPHGNKTRLCVYPEVSNVVQISATEDVT